MMIQLNKFKHTLWLLILLLGIGGKVQAQVVTVTPSFPTTDDSITLVFDATRGNGALRNATQVFAHTGVVIAGPTSNAWTNVIGNWGTNDARVRMTNLGNNLWRISFNIRRFYNLNSTVRVFRLGMVFRNADGSVVGRSETGGDIFLPIYAPNEFAMRIFSPGAGVYSNRVGVSYPFSAGTSLPANWTVTVNGSQTNTFTNVNTISSSINLSTVGNNRVVITAENGNTILRDSFTVFARPETPVAALPSGYRDGINYLSPTTVALVLFAPFKDNIFVIGDFNNWEKNVDYYMNRTPDGNRYWLVINNLQAGREYGFQYLIDSTIRIGDPYCEIVLDENDDQFIPARTYPNRPPYPTGRTNGYVGILQTEKPQYVWRNNNWRKPSQRDAIMYECHIRDFITNRNFSTLTDSIPYFKRLGVNVIKLMPLNEFEGNLSWGYNPSYHYAMDKFYGTRDAFKAFVDSCHGNGIAVVVDMVYNHAFGESPLVRMWWDPVNNTTAPNNPYFNSVARHPFNVGFDFNHQSQATRDYVNRCIRFWIEEYKIDGIRFDLSKGFTQVNSGQDIGAWNRYDQSRIDIWNYYGGIVRSYKQDAWLILEHFADNNEETVLSNNGFMFWGNMNRAYSEGAMGFTQNSDISWGYFRNRGWTQPNLVTYAESHDEERLMFRNRNFGSVSLNYNTRTPGVALDRMKLAAAFLYTIPGPKMLWQFGELGYDFSINHCPDGSINESCRTSDKPIRWDYLRQPDRFKLFQVFQALFRLKTTYNIFESEAFELFQQGDVKRIKLTDGTNNLVVVGNFGIVTRTVNAAFHTTGRWYNFFANDSIQVSNINTNITLAPGEFRILSTERYFPVNPNILISSTENKVKERNGVQLGQIYPNPIQNSFTLPLQLEKDAPVLIQVIDLKGSVVDVIDLGLVNATKEVNNLEINLKKPLANGIYKLNIMAGNARFVESVMIQQ